MKKALLCVSFGTSVPEARAGIDAVARVLRDGFSDSVFELAFTSPTIRKILKSRGEEICSVPEAFEKLLEQGVTDVTVQPTHLLYGIEYDKIRDQVAIYRDKFQSVILGRPLVADTEDMKKLAEVLAQQYPPRDGEALVLFGHGTDHAYNAVYPAMQTAFNLMGRKDVIVGTVEGWPALADVMKELEEGRFRAVRLVPMMLVAGDHAMNDMAGQDEDSWKSVLEGKGYSVSCVMSGLGVLDCVQQMYLQHLLSLGD